MAAAKKRAQVKKSQTQNIEKNVSIADKSIDLTEQTQETEALKKESARKAAMQAARASAKKRSTVTQKPLNETIDIAQAETSLTELKQIDQPEQVKIDADTKTDTSLEIGSSSDDSVTNKKQQAMALAKKRAAERAALKRASNQTKETASVHSEETN